MTGEIHGPAPRPCASCPYRQDVPSGVWHESEYRKLPDYDPDGDITQQLAVFQCHQTPKDDPKVRVCAGWVATHGGAELLSLRVAAARGTMSEHDYRSACEYTTDVPVFDSGAQAAEHGMRDIDSPGLAASQAMGKIIRRRPDVKFRGEA